MCISEKCRLAVATALLGCAAASPVAAAQGLGKYDVAGQLSWRAQARVASVARGSGAIVSGTGGMRLPDGVALGPWQAGAPVGFGDGAPRGTVTPTTSSCRPATGGRCTAAADFKYAYPDHVSLAGDGLQKKAVNFVSSAGDRTTLPTPDRAGDDAPIARAAGSSKGLTLDERPAPQPRRARDGHTHIPPAGVSSQTGALAPANTEGVRYADQFPGSDIGAKVDAAIASLPGGGRVVIPAGTYSFSTTIRVNRPVWLVGEGVAATTLDYTGSGDAIQVEAGSAPPYLNGGLGRFTLTGNASANAVGVHQVDTIGFSYRDLAIVHFQGANGAGIWMDNEPASYCPNCAAGYSERTRWDRVSFFENSVGLKFSDNGGTNSFEYSWMRASHFQINNGQIGIWLAGSGAGSIAVQHSDMEFMANICLSNPTGPGGTVASVSGGAAWYQGFIHAAAEQSCGTTPGRMWDVDATSYVDAWGDYIASPLANHVAPGGVLLFGLYGPTQVWGTNHVSEDSSLDVPLGVDGDTSSHLAGDGNIALAGQWRSAGQLNESVGLGGDAASGAAVAGIGFDYGASIQHPLSWCYLGDVTHQCFAWFTKADTQEPISGAPGAWLTSSPAWEFFADAFGSKTPAPAQSGVLRLASGDTIDWRNAAGTADIGLGKNAFDQLDMSEFSALVVPPVEVSGGATIRAPTGSGTLALTSQLPLAATTAALGGAALTAGQCASASVAVDGATTTMAVVATPATYPGDGFYWVAYISTPGTVAVKLCAVVNGTPAASAFNVRVVR